MQILYETIILVILAIVGWQIFRLLKIPVPSFLGALAILGGLRASGMDIPMAPAFIAPIVQTLLGIYIGSKIDRETIKDLKNIGKSALIISIWSIATVFILGLILYRFTYLDLYTALLSSSMGGLPEMTMIAIDTNSDVATIVVIHLFKIIATLTIFPIFIKYYYLKRIRKNGEVNIIDEEVRIKGFKNNVIALINYLININGKTILRIIISLVIASIGGYIFTILGVPAGFMVGAMIFIAIASIIGVRVIPPTKPVFSFLLLGIGIMIANYITSDNVDIIISGQILLPLLITSIFVFGTSILIAYAIHKILKWDLLTCFLAAAPGGFTIMSTLAITYGKDPFRVSMLHLCRIMIIKLVVPFTFMLLV